MPFCKSAESAAELLLLLLCAKKQEMMSLQKLCWPFLAKWLLLLLSASAAPCDYQKERSNPVSHAAGVVAAGLLCLLLSRSVSLSEHLFPRTHSDHDPRSRQNRPDPPPPCTAALSHGNQQQSSHPPTKLARLLFSHSRDRPTPREQELALHSSCRKQATDLRFAQRNLVFSLSP